MSRILALGGQVIDPVRATPLREALQTFTAALRALPVGALLPAGRALC